MLREEGEREWGVGVEGRQEIEEEGLWKEKKCKGRRDTYIHAHSVSDKLGVAMTTYVLLIATFSFFLRVSCMTADVFVISSITCGVLRMKSPFE